MQTLRRILVSLEWWLIIIPILAYWQIAFCCHPMQWDMTDQTFVWHRFISECFHNHIIPLWCPYSRLGYPFYADPQSGLFDPVTWVLAYFSHYSLYTNNIEFIFHVTGAAFGMNFLLRSLGIQRYTSIIFGLVYAFSGPFVSNATHSTFIGSLCWTPFIIGSYIRLMKTMNIRWALLTGMLLFLHLTGGYIGISIILLYFLAGIFFYYLATNFAHYRQSIKRLFLLQATVGSVTLILSIGSLYSVAQGLPYMDRAEGITKAMANTLAYTPKSLLTLLIPAIGSNEHIQFDTDITMRNLYLGIFTLLFAVVSLFRQRKNRWLIFIISLLFLGFALGSATPLRTWLYKFLPLMNLFRMTSIFRFFTAIGLITLAALAFDDIFEYRLNFVRSVFKKMIVIVSAIMILAIIILVIKPSGIQLPNTSSLPDLTDSLRHLHVSSVAFFQLAIDILLLISSLSALYTANRYSPTGKYILGFLIIVDLSIGVQLNMFSTISAPRGLSQVQHNINKLPQGFPMISNTSLASCSEWNDTSIAPPVWHNAGFMKKEISYEGNNSFNLKTYSLLYDRPDFYKRLESRKFIELSDDSAHVSIAEFNPVAIRLAVDSKTDMTVSVGQMYDKNWQISEGNISGSYMLPEDSTHFIRFGVQSGHHDIKLSYEPAGIKFLFFYTVIIFSILLILLLYLFVRPLFYKNDLSDIML